MHILHWIHSSFTHCRRNKIRWYFFSTRKRPRGIYDSTWYRIVSLYYPVILSHFSPAPVKSDRAVPIQQTNQVKVNLSSTNQSINRKLYDESPRLIDWFCTSLGKLPYGYSSRVNAKSDSTLRDIRYVRIKFRVSVNLYEFYSRVATTFVNALHKSFLRRLQCSSSIRARLAARS